MADTVTLPLTGSGGTTAVVATDDAGAGGHVQIIKLAISTDGSATVIPADASNGLDVDVTRVSGNVATTIADAANVVEGAVADAIVAAGATGTISAKLRRVTQGLEDLKSLVVLAAGSNTIGNVGTIATSVTPGTGAANLGKAEDAAHSSGDAGVYMLGTRQDTPAATAGTSGDYQGPAFDTTGRQYVDAALDTSALMNAGASLTPKFANIAVASSGNNTIVSAVTSKKIRVLSCAIVASAATNIYFVDGAGSPVALFGNSTNKINLAANGGFVLPFNPLGWFETSTTNVAVNLNLSAANAVGGGLSYVEV